MVDIKFPKGMKYNKETFWHSASHILAQAVKELYPKVKLTIGPAIEDGFYYDFDKKEPFDKKDLKKIEQKMREIINKDLEFKKEEVSLKKAKEIFKDNPYKLELIEDLKKGGAKKVSIYKHGDFIDLCKGPHVKSTGQIKAVKLTKISSAYWRGKEENQQLQRIYGIAFPDKKQLKEYLTRLEEAKKRDHTKIGQKLDLFSIHDIIGSGLPIFHPKGKIIRQEMKKVIREKNKELDFQEVSTPHIAKSTLWHKSGHYEAYKDKMFIFNLEDSEWAVKPMNCPFHCRIYKSQARSYRDLPFRLSEFATVYRNEQSGELSGLLRVRAITQDDGHAYLMLSQIEKEFSKIVLGAIDVLKTFGIEDITINIATKPDKAIGEDEVWQKAEEAIKKSLEKVDLDYQVQEGEGAFYGPKVDIEIKDAIGREWQCSTVQLDFFMPERFDLEYMGEDGTEHKPVMIHRALVGSLERFMAILIEHYAGNLPLWLNPNQIVILPIADRHNKQAEEIASRFKDVGARVDIDNRTESVSKKVRDAQKQKYNFMITIGDREVQDDTIAARSREGVVKQGLDTEDFLNKIEEALKQRKETVSLE